MSERCLLYIDGENESDLAKEVCNRYGINYSLIDLRNFRSSDINAPRLVSDMGRFEGIQRIIYYAETFGKVKKNH